MPKKQHQFKSQRQVCFKIRGGAALSFLIAISDPKEKEKMIKIVTNLLAG